MKVFGVGVGCSCAVKIIAPACAVPGRYGVSQLVLVTVTELQGPLPAVRSPSKFQVPPETSSDPTVMPAAGCDACPRATPPPRLMRATAAAIATPTLNRRLISCLLRFRHGHIATAWS